MRSYHILRSAFLRKLFQEINVEHDLRSELGKT